MNDDKAVNRETNNTRAHDKPLSSASLAQCSCESVQDLMVEYLTHELSDEQRKLIEGHVNSGCALCKQHLDRLRTGKNLLLKLVPERELSNGLRERILASAAATQVNYCSEIDKPQVATSSVTGRKGSRRQRLESAIIGLAMFAAGIMVAAIVGGIDRTKPTEVDLAVNTQHDPITTTQDVAAELTEAPKPNRRSVPTLEDSSHRSITLTSGNTDAATLAMRGEAIFDFSAKQVHFFGSHFPEPPTDKDYVLWLQYEPDGPMDPTHTLELTREGHCKSVVNLAQDKCHRIFVTLESNGQLPAKPSSEQPLLLLQPD